MQPAERERLKVLLKQYAPSKLERESCKLRFLSFVEENEECFDRAFKAGHVTASAWLLNHDRTKALLTHHRKLNQWMQLGGHCEKRDRDLLSAAIREAREESGLFSIEPLRTDLFDIDIHQIPSSAKEPAHFHYDVRFLLSVINPKEEISVSEESNQLKWIGIDDQDACVTDPSVSRLIFKWRSEFAKSGRSSH